MKNLFGMSRRCILMIAPERLAELLNLPEGGRVVGVDWDAGRHLILIGVEGTSQGFPPPAKPPEITLQIEHLPIHRLLWPNDQASPVPMPEFNIGPRLVQTPLPPPEQAKAPFPGEEDA